LAAVTFFLGTHAVENIMQPLWQPGTHLPMVKIFISQVCFQLAQIRIRVKPLDFHK
jgi:hypothetical protein